LVIDGQPAFFLMLPAQYIHTIRLPHHDDRLQKNASEDLLLLPWRLQIISPIIHQLQGAFHCGEAARESIQHLNIIIP